MKNNTRLLDWSLFLLQRDLFLPVSGGDWPPEAGLTLCRLHQISEARNTNRLTNTVTPSPWELGSFVILLCGIGPNSDDLPGLKPYPQNILHRTGESNTQMKPKSHQ